MILKTFNAFQIVGLFAAWPFLIGWLGQSEFSGATALWVVAGVVYALGFIGLVACVVSCMCREDR